MWAVWAAWPPRRWSSISPPRPWPWPIGLVLGNIFQPGVGLDLSTANLSAKEVAAPSLVQVLMGIVPLNPVDALAKGNILQIIFFAVLVGMAISPVPVTRPSLPPPSSTP